MQLLKLSVLTSLLFAFAISFTSCEKEAEKKKGGSYYSKTEIPMTGAQSVPATPSGGTGKLSVSYSKGNKTLNYSFSWTGLTDTIRAVRIYGPAPTGYGSATVKQDIPAFTSNLRTNQTSYPYQSGSYTGSVIIDGLVFTEQDLLNHLYYISITTKAYGFASPMLPGEIRAQIRFQ
ncbi:MAG TPA: CHRD domain-containing protein [Chitinophagaceae bacterium]